MAPRYWCHMCSQRVNPIIEVEIKCPFCQSGFVEEMSSSTRENQELESDFSSDRALSLWAPVLLGMMGNPRVRRRVRRMEPEEDGDDSDDGEAHHGGESELYGELESIMRRRRRSSGTKYHNCFKVFELERYLNQITLKEIGVEMGIEIELELEIGKENESF